jgi:hypothetical protein
LATQIYFGGDIVRRRARCAYAGGHAPEFAVEPGQRDPIPTGRKKTAQQGGSHRQRRSFTPNPTTTEERARASACSRPVNCTRIGPQAGEGHNVRVCSRESEVGRRGKVWRWAGKGEGCPKRMQALFFLFSFLFAILGSISNQFQV